MFQSALAAQDDACSRPRFTISATRVLTTALELLKKGPDAQKARRRATRRWRRAGRPLATAGSALAENDLNKMITAYLEGRGARHELRDAEKAVQAAMETYGKTLEKWQRAADDFKSAAELNPADTNAAHNAEIVEQGIAKLVDSLQKCSRWPARSPASTSR